MTTTQSNKIKSLAVQYYNEGMTDLHLIRETIQYSPIYWDKEIFFTNDEVFSLVQEAINELQPIEQPTE